MEAIVSFENFSLDIAGKNILSEIQLDVKQGELLAVIGASGSGKSMLLRSFTALFEDIANWSVRGKLVFRHDGNSLNPFDLEGEQHLKLRRECISYVLQQSAQVLNPSKRIKSILKSSAISAGQRIDQSDMIKVLEDTGFDSAKEVLDKFPHQFSGGQVQRILIAAALLRRTQLLLVDEPTSNLDTVLKKEILNLLLALKDDYGFSLVIVSHNLPLIKEYCDRIAVIKAGKLIFSGTYSELMVSDKSLLQSFTDSFQAHRRRQEDYMNAEVLLSLKDISLTYKTGSSLDLSTGQTEVFRNFNFSLYPSETVGIAGPSGSGKSSLARIISGLLPPSSGEILFESRSSDEFTVKDWKEFRSRVQMIYQDPLSALTPHRNGRQVLEEVADLYGRPSDYASLVAYLEQFHLGEDILEKLPSQMSGGQRQRLLIARALMTRPRILVCDEILSSLDKAIQSKVLELIIELKHKYRISLVLISHDTASLELVCDRVVYLDARF